MIRRMEMFDIENTIPLMQRSFVKNIAHQGMTWNIDTVHKTAELLINKGITLLYERETVEAVMSGIVVPSIFDSNTILSQVLIWYSEASPGVALRMFKRYEKLSKEQGADLILFGSPLEIEVNNADIYSRLGFKKIESQYVKEI